MPRTRNSPPITIRSLTAADLPALRVVILDIYERKSSLWRYVGLTAEGYSPVYDQLEKHLDLDTSAIALIPSGDIVGFFITTPFDASFDLSMANEACRAVHLILRSLDPWLRENIISKGGRSEQRILHIVSNGTADGYEGLGLNRRLRSFAVSRAKECGWEMLASETGEPIVQGLMRDVDKFEVGTQIAYNDFELEGKRPFQGRDGGIMLFYSELNRSADNGQAVTAKL